MNFNVLARVERKEKVVCLFAYVMEMFMCLENGAR